MNSAGINVKYSKIRIIQFITAEFLLVVGIFIIFGRLEPNIFFALTIGLALPTLFSEPYFTPPRAALITAISQVGTYFASDTANQKELWGLLIIISAVVGLSALVAIWNNQKSDGLFYWIATRFGRPVVLGSIVSMIVIRETIISSQAEGVWIIMLIGAVYAVIFMDWSKLFLYPNRTSHELASITSVIAPNQLQLSTFSTFSVGQRVEVESANGRSYGYVAEELASDSGSRYRVILDKHWREVTNDSGTPCLIHLVEDGEPKPKGFAIEGSTESVIRLNPVSKLKIGQTLETEDAEGKLFYQVTGLELEEEVWANSAAIVPRAKLVQIGALNDNMRIVIRPDLPSPYQKVTTASESSIELGAEFMKIGVLKGTNVPVGIRKDWQSSHGHLGILGMSGMGKTTVAAKLAGLAREGDRFIVLDETSEYRTRLNLKTVAPVDLSWDEGGVSVCEPGGELPAECRKIVESAMKAAHLEYEKGVTPRRRYLLLEEAHGWLPEWNFTTQEHTKEVNKTSRYILQARKFNLTFVMVSQRTAVISKSALSQCENYIILRTLDQTSLEYVEGIVGQELKNVIPELGRYEAICVGPIFNSDSPIIVTLDQ